MSLIDRVHTFKYAKTHSHVKLFVGEECVGLVPPSFAETLAGYADVWQKNETALILHPRLIDFQERTQEIDRVLRDLSARGILPNEPNYEAFGGTDWFPVGKQRLTNPYFKIRRFYSRFLGVQFDSIEVNGYMHEFYWQAQRSQYVDFAKGKYDIMIAGAVRNGHTILEEIREEGKKECGLREEDMAFLKPVSVIQFFHTDKNDYLINEIFHIYDFDTGQNGFLPSVQDPHEVVGFDAVPFDNLLNMILDGTRIKPEIMVTEIDFLIRHNHIKPNHPDYESLKHLLAQTHDFYA